MSDNLFQPLVLSVLFYLCFDREEKVVYRQVFGAISVAYGAGFIYRLVVSIL